MWRSLLEFLLTKIAFVSELTEQKLTVGKIYAGLLIAENWKSFKATGKTGGRSTVLVTCYTVCRMRRAVSGKTFRLKALRYGSQYHGATVTTAARSPKNRSRGRPDEMRADAWY